MLRGFNNLRGLRAVRGLGASNVFCGTDIHGNPIYGSTNPDGSLSCPNIAGVPYDPAHPPTLPVVSSVIPGGAGSAMQVIPGATPTYQGPTQLPIPLNTTPISPLNTISTFVGTPGCPQPGYTYPPGATFPNCPGYESTTPLPAFQNSNQATASSVAAAIAPSLPPGTPGAMPSGPSGTSYNNTCSLPLYRFILAMSGSYATGANYPGCSQTNSGMCDPQSFPTLAAAIQYALSKGEIPYQVLSSQEPWAIISCAAGIDPTRVYNPDGSQGGSGISLTTLALVAGVAFLLMRGKL
jgi:hypothetical protein